MIKIQVLESEEQSTMYIEGEVSGGSVNELERCWLAIAGTAHHRVVVSFNSVVRVDREGRKLLRSMHEHGVTFTGARLAMQDVLDEITANRF